MSWHKVLGEHQLQPGQRRVVRVGTLRVLLIHHAGEIFAVDNACPHMHLPPQWGRLGDDCSLIGPWHHSAFDLRTGDVKAWSPRHARQRAVIGKRP